MCTLHGEEAKVLNRDQEHVTIIDRRAEHKGAISAPDRTQHILWDTREGFLSE
jgi:hypothetical protein